MIKHRTKIITPKTAQQILDKTVAAGVKNRNLNHKVVEQYAEAMKQGEWKLNGESISFDEDGFLLNGQHRLHACILANTPFETDIATGVDRATFDTIDSGRGRSAGQVVQMSGHKYGNLIASIVRGVEQIHSDGHLGNNDLKITNAYVLSESNKYHELLDYIAASVATVPSHGLPSKILGSVFFYLVHDLHQDIDTVENFIHGIVSLDTNPNQAIDKFRKWLITTRNKNLHTSKRTLYGFIVLTWNAMVEGTDKLPTYSEKCEASFANEMPEFIRIK